MLLRFLSARCGEHLRRCTPTIRYASECLRQTAKTLLWVCKRPDGDQTVGRGFVWTEAGRRAAHFHESATTRPGGCQKRRGFLTGLTSRPKTLQAEVEAETNLWRLKRGRENAYSSLTSSRNLSLMDVANLRASSRERTRTLAPASAVRLGTSEVTEATSACVETPCYEILPSLRSLCTMRTGSAAQAMTFSGATKSPTLARMWRSKALSWAAS